MILSYASSQVKGDRVTDYDISRMPKPFSCPVEQPLSFSRRLLGFRETVRNHLNKWLDLDTKYLNSKHPDFFKSIFELAHDQGLNHECH